VPELERQHLMPMPAPFDSYGQEFSRVSSTCPVTAAGNLYAVPCELARHTVRTRLCATRVVIVADERVLAEQPRQAGRSETVYDWRHYAPLVRRKPGPLRNRALSWTYPSRWPRCAEPCSSMWAGTG
jgi:hypothetical protein